MWLQVFGAQGDLTAHAGLHRHGTALTTTTITSITTTTITSTVTILLPCGQAAVAQHHPLLLLALQAHEAALSAILLCTAGAPGLSHTRLAKAVAAGQQVGLVEEVTAHGAGELLVH